MYVYVYTYVQEGKWETHRVTERFYARFYLLGLKHTVTVVLSEQILTSGRGYIRFGRSAMYEETRAGGELSLEELRKVKRKFLILS